VNEVIVDIKGFEGLYQVSNFGDIYVIKDGVPVKLKPVYNKKLKLWHVSLYNPATCKRYWRKLKNGKMAYCMLPQPIPIYRLVARAFLPPMPSPTHIMRHKDLNRANNRADNLEWVPRQTIFNGESNPAAKLTAQAVRMIRAARGSKSAKTLATEYHIGIYAIYEIWSGKTWREVV
jgi:hypothetical protein